MVNHGVSTGALFILVGMIYERRHVRDLDAFGGLARVMPVFAAFFVIATMSSVGLPGLNGFVGEFLILLGAFSQPALVGGDRDERRDPLGGVHAVGGAARVLRPARARGEPKVLLDLSPREKLVAVALVIPMIWIGVHPSTFTNPMDRAVTELLETMSRRAPDIAAHARGPRRRRPRFAVQRWRGDPADRRLGGRADDAGGARRAGPADVRGVPDPRAAACSASR